MATTLDSVDVVDGVLGEQQSQQPRSAKAAPVVIGDHQHHHHHHHHRAAKIGSNTDSAMVIRYVKPFVPIIYLAASLCFALVREALFPSAIFGPSASFTFSFGYISLTLLI